MGAPGFDCDPTEGTPITVDWRAAAAGVDFEVAPLGTLSGVVTDAATDLPLAGASVLAFADPAQASHDSLVFTDQAGGFTMVNLLPRSYYLVASKSGYQAELYDDLPCALGICDRSLGQSVAVPLGVAVAGIDFELARQGSLSGTVRNARTGEPLAATFVRFALPGRFNLGAAMTNSHGRYLLTSVPPGGVHEASNRQGSHRLSSRGVSRAPGSCQGASGHLHGAPGSCQGASGHLHGAPGSCHGASGSLHGAHGS